MGILANENAISSGGYQISNSLRFQSASSQYASRTPAGAGNRQKWTWSGWVKLGTLGVVNGVFGASTSSTATDFLYFNGSLVFQSTVGSVILATTQVFRDPSAWYHIIVAVDTTQATASNRVLMYVNGSQITSFSSATYPTQNSSLNVNNNISTKIGSILSDSNATYYFDGYMTEINFIDGQALTPSSFGATNATSGQWCAAKYTGTYGTNGFYLPFSNGTSTTTLGADSSGNGNNWTLTNFTRSAGVSDCWMYDVPSGNGSSGTQPNSNYCVMNPLINTAGYVTVSKSNLQASVGAADKVVYGTIAIPLSGKWYWESTVTTVGAATLIGVDAGNIIESSGAGFSNNVFRAYQQNGNKSEPATAYGASFTTGDVIGVAVDMDAGTITFYKNNTSQGVAFSNLAGSTWYPCVYINSATNNLNFGQRSFAYTPPTGFKALCTANLPDSTVKKGNIYMDATTYTGTGSSLAVTNAGSFKPDFVWCKVRNTAGGNVLFDSIRGPGKLLVSNSTGAETGNTGDLLSAFNSNGFQVNTTYLGGTDGSTDGNGNSYVGWQWQAGQGTTSSNTSGSITSTVSVNATAGFSVVTYTGTGANATVGHGLGVAPKMVIIKSRSAAGTAWPVWQSTFVTASNTDYLRLNSTIAKGGVGAANYWNATVPTSSVISVGTDVDVNQSTSTYVAYCFAEIAGFSKFTSYTGNGSADGTFTYTGFTPKYILIKGNAVSDWVIHDATRNPYNVADKSLYANTSGAETTSEPIDILSNGFKIRTTAGNVNNNGTTYIVMAFASNPFAQSNSF